MTATRTNVPTHAARVTNDIPNSEPAETLMENPDEQAESALEATQAADVRPSDSDDLEVAIQRTAYDIFISRGGGDGDDLADWFEAERIVRHDRGSESS
jgi:hypothetical protein